MADTFSAKAILSAEDKNFTSTFSKAEGILGKVSGMASSGLGFGVLAGVGQAAFGAITSGAKNVVGSILDTGMSFESATSQIAATMGKPKEAISDVIAEADRLGKTTAFTATEAAEGMNILAMAGMDAQQQIGTAANVLNLASAGAESMDAAASQVVGTMKGFGMAMSNANEAAASSKEVADLLAKGASMANTNVSQLGTALSQSAASAATYGQSIKGTEVALLRLAEQNVTGAEASTALNRAMMDLYTPTSTAAKALKKLGVSAYDSNGKARDFNTVVDELSASMEGMSDSEKNAYKNAIFSTFGLQAFNKMCVSSEDTVNKFADGLDHASDGIGSAADMAKTQLDNLQGDLTLLSSAADGLKNTIYGSINSPLRSVVQTVTELTTGFDKFLSTANLGSIAGQAKALAAAVGAVAVANGGLSVMPALFGKIDAAGALMTDTISHAPGAVVKAFQTGYSKLPGVVQHEFSNLGAIAKNYTDMVKMDIGKGLTEMIPGIGKAGQAATTAMKGVGTGLKTAAGVGTKALSGMTEALISLGKTALMSIAPAALLGVVLAGMGLIYSQFRNQIDEMIRTAAEKGPETITNFVEGITSQIPRLVSSGSMLLSHLMTGITANIPALFEGGVSIVDTLVSSVGSNASRLMTSGIHLVGTLITSLLNAIPQLLMTGMNFLLSLSQGMLNNLPLIVSTALWIIGTLTSNFSSYLPQFLAVGIQILMNLASGAIQALPVLIAAAFQGIASFIQTISQNLPTILAAGVAIIGMLVSGIVQNLPMILASAVQAVASLIQGIAQNFPLIIQSGIMIIGQLVIGLLQMLPTIFKAGFDLIVSLGKGIIEAVPNVITGAVEGVKGVFSDLWSALKGESSDGTGSMKSTTDIDMSAIESTTVGTANVIQGTFNGLWPGIAAEAAQSTGSMASATAADMQAVSDSAAGAASASENAFSGLWDRLASEASSGTSSMASTTGADMGTLIGHLQNASSESASQVASMNSAFGQIGATMDVPEGRISAFPGLVGANFNQLGGIGQQGGSELTSSFASEVSVLPETAQSNVDGVVLAFNSGVQPIVTSGQQAMSGFNTALKTGGSQAVGVSKALVSSIATTMNSGQPKAFQAGAYIGQGLANGLNSKVGPVRAAAAKLAAAANAAIAAKAKIGSPSKITTQDGKWYGDGFVNGIMARVDDARRAAEKLVSFPKLAQSSFDDMTFGGASLQAEAEFASRKDITIVTYSQIDGRTVAKSTAKYTEAELDKRKTRKDRKAGVA